MTARVAIVGAGPAGLAAVSALRRRGLELRVFERADRVGGLWDISRPVTPIYDTTHLISSAPTSGFEAAPMPGHFPDYPSHGLVLGYLREYAATLELDDNVDFDVEVSALTAVADGWMLTLSGGRTSGPFSDVVLATGHQWEPRLPKYMPDFAGLALHSLHYRSPDLLRGRRVLIVGGGNSACDIACDAAPLAARVWLSMRRGYHFFPKHIAGIPADQFSARLRRRADADDAAKTIEGMLRSVVGDPVRFGLPRPDHRPFDSNPIVNTQVLHFIAQGDVQPVADVAAVAGTTVQLADGDRIKPDVIVFATGYQHRVRLLDTVRGDRGRKGNLILNVVAADADGIFVTGLFETDGSAFPLLSLQAELVAACIDRRRDVPARMVMAPFADADTSGGRRFVDSERHRISVDRITYTQTLERAIAIAGRSHTQWTVLP